MIAALTVIGWWCIISATLSAGFVTTLAGRAAVVATDLLFSLVGIGVLCLLLAGRVA